MKIFLIVTIGVLVSVLLWSVCTKDRRETANRLEQSIQYFQQKNMSNTQALVLKALQKATPETLKVPELVYTTCGVRLEHGKPQSVRLWGTWIEKEPTVDAVLVRNTQTGYKKDFEFDDLIVEEINKQFSERPFVDFLFFSTVEPQSDTCKELHAQVAEGNAEAVLLRNGKQISNVVKVQLVESDYTDLTD